MPMGPNNTGSRIPTGEQLLVRAQLPNKQRTTRSVARGSSLKDSLAKALDERKLKISNLNAFRINTKDNSRQRIDWDVDVAMLMGDEILVEYKEGFPTHTQLSHNFVNFRMFPNFTKCHFCKSILLTGIKCLDCGIEFHKKLSCSSSVPHLCKPPAFENSDNQFGENGLPTLEHGWSATDAQDAQNRELLEERWEIDGSEIERLERIGQGSFATVYKGNWHGPVALKELNVKAPTQAQLEDFKNEVVVLKRTRHANVLLFIGYVLKPELIIVTQWCKGRSLYKYLHVDNGRDLTNSEMHHIAIGVAQGMEYLHAKNILHRDLKSNNIFIHDKEDFTVKIGDFGLATFKTRYEGDQQTYHPTGSILWMAPEVICTRRGVNPFSFESDVYSFGIVLYELLTRKLPYYDFRYKEALFFLIGLGDPQRSPKLNLQAIEDYRPKALKRLMLNCSRREPSKRPQFTSVLQDLKKIKLSRLMRSTSLPTRLKDLMVNEMPTVDQNDDY